MEPPVARSRGRPRKRRREEDEIDAHDRKLGLDSKRQAALAKPIVLVGRYVLKDFKQNGVFLGKVVFYDTGLYRVNYEDGDFEDLESGEIRRILLNDVDFDDDLTRRRIKLDETVLKCDVLIGNKSENTPPSEGASFGASRANVSELNELSGETSYDNNEEQGQTDDDSCSDSSEGATGSVHDLNPQAISIPPLQFLPSSGTIGVPEQYVSLLLSVYGFLRSFSIRLFLTPFSMDEFVGSLNCCHANTLIDAIHVSLLRGLRSHLETLSSEGSEIASNCLRCSDWSLLDILTWPVYVVQYLTINGYIKGLQWDGFYNEVFNREYYSLAVGRKLMILQILCDDVLDWTELRTEFDMRELAEVGNDYEAEAPFALENGPRRVHPRNAKTSACRDRNPLNMISEPLDLKDSKGSADADVDRNGDECQLCGMDGTLLCCDGCPFAYHSRCIGVMKSFIPPGPWYCPECKINKAGLTIAKGTCLRGAVTFGMDIFGHFFITSCDHLLIIKASGDGEFCLRYYNRNDIPKVVRALYSSPQHRALYFDICQTILLYWNFPGSLLSLADITGTDRLASERSDADLSCSLVSSVDKDDCHVVCMGEVENSEATLNESKDDIVSGLDSSLGTLKNELSDPEIPGESKKQGCAVLNNKLPEGIISESSSSGSGSCQTDMLRLMHDARSSAQDQSICISVSSSESFRDHPNGTFLPVDGSSKYEEAGYVGSGKLDPSLINGCVYMGSSFKRHSYINYYVHGDLAASAAGKLEAISSEESRISSSENSRKTASGIIALQAKAFSLTASRFFWPTIEKKLVEVPRERCGWCFSCKAPVSSKRGCMLNHAALSVTKGTMKVLAGLRPVRNGEGNLSCIATYLIYLEESLHGLTVGPFRSGSFREQWRKRVEQVTTCSALKHLLLEFEHNVRCIALSSDWVKMVDDWFIESSVIQNSACTGGIGAANRRGPNSRRNRKQATVEDVMVDDSKDSNLFWWRGKLSRFLFHRAVLPLSIVRKAACQGGSRKISGIAYADGSELPRRSRQLVWRAAVEMSKNTSQLALQVRYFDFYLRWNDLIRPEQNGQDGKGADTEASAFRNAVISDKKLVENKILYAVAFGSQKHLPSRVMKNIVETEKSLGDEKYWFSESRIPLYLIKEYEVRVDKPPSSEECLTLLPKLQSRKWRPMYKDIFFYLICKRDNLDMCYCSACQLAVPVRDTVKCNACEGYCHSECSVSSTVSTNEEVDALFNCRRCYQAKIFSQNETNNESPTSTLVFHGQAHNLASTANCTKIKFCNQSLITKPQDTPEVKTGVPVLYSTTKSQRKQKGASASGLTTKSKCRDQGPSGLTTKSKCRDQGPSGLTTKSKCRDQDPSGSSVSAKSRRRPCSWGIIWRKKNVDNDGVDFRLKNILLRGSSDAHHVEAICLLCRKPYRSDLMYICCEKCKNWYHADAVELEESNFFDVVGFKCCKCRRIKSPVCPYSDSKDKNLQDGRKIQMRSLQQEQSGVDSDSGIISDYKESEPATPMFTGEEVTDGDHDPLLFSLETVELVTESNPEVDTEWNDSFEPVPQKLPVRRHLKREGDDDDLFESQSCGAFETNLETYLNPADDVSSYNTEDCSIAHTDVNMMNDCENVNFDDMEFEPNTYFSVTELLEQDDGDQFNEVDISGIVLEYPLSENGINEKCEGDTDFQRSENLNVIKVSFPQCWRCSLNEPSPDLSCEICGLCIHSRCSPWDESACGLGCWRCGNCREWR